MQLVYLWVAEYKNIKNQGFNFSPDFECDYDKDSNKLKIEPKKHTRIFPNNINVTAIVGENGSGKSSVLNLLIDIFNVFASSKIEKIYYNLSESKHIILIFLDSINDDEVNKKYIFEITENKSKIECRQEHTHILINKSTTYNNYFDLLDIPLLHYDFSYNFYTTYQKNKTKFSNTTDIYSESELYYGDKEIQLVPDKINVDLNNEKKLLIKYIISNNNLLVNKYFEPIEIKIDVSNSTKSDISDILYGIIIQYLKNHEKTKDEFQNINSISELQNWIQRENQKKKMVCQLMLGISQKLIVVLKNVLIF